MKSTRGWGEGEGEGNHVHDITSMTIIYLVGRYTVNNLINALGVCFILVLLGAFNR